MHGADGLDEITTADKTYVAACSHTGKVETFTLSPDDFGLKRQHFDGFRGKDPQENAQLIRAILRGAKTKTTIAARDLVIINAAAALHLAGVAPDLRWNVLPRLPHDQHVHLVGLIQRDLKDDRPVLGRLARKTGGLGLRRAAGTGRT